MGFLRCLMGKKWNNLAKAKTPLPLKKKMRQQNFEHNYLFIYFCQNTPTKIQERNKKGKQNTSHNIYISSKP